MLQITELEIICNSAPKQIAPIRCRVLSSSRLRGVPDCWFCASRRACCAAYEPVRCTVLVPAGMTAACSCCQFCRGCAFRDSQTSNAGCIRMLRTRSEVLCSNKTGFCLRCIWQNTAERQFPPSAMPAGTLVPCGVPLTGSVGGLQTASQLLWENLSAACAFIGRRAWLMPGVTFRLDAAAGCF